MGKIDSLYDLCLECIALELLDYPGKYTVVRELPDEVFGDLLKMISKFYKASYRLKNEQSKEASYWRRMYNNTRLYNYSSGSD